MEKNQTIHYHIEDDFQFKIAQYTLTQHLIWQKNLLERAKKIKNPDKSFIEQLEEMCKQSLDVINMVLSWEKQVTYLEGRNRYLSFKVTEQQSDIILLKRKIKEQEKQINELIKGL